jgi:DNA-binding HxlR family transcriptional regulator
MVESVCRAGGEDINFAEGEKYALSGKRPKSEERDLTMRRKERDSCGFAAALDAIGGKWKTSILWELHLRPHRFAELRRSMGGVSEKMLTQQLRQMEADGLVSRCDHGEVPPRVDYSITPLGLSLNDAVTAMSAWGKYHETWKSGRQEAA